MKQADAIRNSIKRNLIWVIFLLVLLVSLVVKNQEINIPITTNYDTELILSSGDIVEQTWQANVKRVIGLSVPYDTKVVGQNVLLVQFVEAKTDEILSEERIVVNEQDGNFLNINIKPIRLNISEQYVIKIKNIGENEDNQISFKTYSQGAGCRINGIDAEKALKLDIVGTKTRNISWLVFTFVPFALVSILFMVLWNKKWEETIGIAVIAVTTVIMMGGLLGNLEWGIYVAYFISLVCGIIGIYLYNEKKLGIKDLISPGLFVYILFVGLILINCNELYVAWYDDFSHWGLYVKDMFSYDALGKHLNSIIVHVYYPPFMSVLEYYFTYINGFYADKFLYIAYQIMMASCLVIVFKSAKKNIYMVVPSTIAVVTGVITFYNDVFSKLYVDAMLAIFVAYVLICYFANKLDIFNWICIFGGLFALTYTKLTGVVLAGLVTIVIVCDAFCEVRKKYTDIKRIIHELVWSCASVLFVCVLFILWQFYLSSPIKSSGEVKQIIRNEVSVVQKVDVVGSSGMSVHGIVDFLTGKGADYQYETLRVFGDKIVSGSFVKIKEGSLSCLEIYIIVILGSLIWFSFIKDREIRKKMQRYIVFSAIAGGIYIVFLLFTYLFTFSPQEAIGVSHHERYISSWICGMVVALLAIVIIRIGNDKNCLMKGMNIMTIILLTCLIFVVPVEKLNERRSDKINMEEFYSQNESLMEKIRQTGTKEDKYIYICNSEASVDYWRYQYLLCPMKLEIMVLEECEQNGIYRIIGEKNEMEYIEKTSFLLQ